MQSVSRRGGGTTRSSLTVTGDGSLLYLSFSLIHVSENHLITVVHEERSDQIRSDQSQAKPSQAKLAAEAVGLGGGGKNTRLAHDDRCSCSQTQVWLHPVAAAARCFPWDLGPLHLCRRVGCRGKSRAASGVAASHFSTTSSNAQRLVASPLPRIQNYRSI
jgi:hypothetical protein